MKDINLYILEKFKINKNTIENQHPLNKGDLVIPILFRLSENKNFILIDISMPKRFIEIKDNELIYISPLESNIEDTSKYHAWDVQNRLFINSKGYFQHNFRNEEIIVKVFLNKEASIDYIKRCIKEKDNIDRTFITSIADIKDIEKINKFTISLCTTEKALHTYLDTYLTKND